MRTLWLLPLLFCASPLWASSNPKYWDIPPTETRTIAVTLMNFPDDLVEPFTTVKMNGIVFDGPISLANYLKEVSMGSLRITGRTRGWFQMPHPRSWYCSDTPTSLNLVYQCNLGLMWADVMPFAEPAQQTIFFVAGYGPTGFGGVNSQFHGAEYGWPLKWIIHEFGHTMLFAHAGAARVGDIAGASCTDLTDPVCKQFGYGDNYDPMGVATYHYSANRKNLKHWGGTIKTPTGGDYDLMSVESPLAGWKELQVTAAGRVYSIEYRTQTGFDAVDWGGIGLAAPMTGLVVRQLVEPGPGHDWTTVLLASGPGPLLVPGMRVEIVSQRSDRATVRVTLQ